MAHCKWCETKKILDLGLLDFGPIGEKGPVRWKVSKETRERWNAKDKEPSAAAPSLHSNAAELEFDRTRRDRSVLLRGVDLS